MGEAPVDAQSTWEITESSIERISILTSVLSNGYWRYGYYVRWTNGRVSSSKPDPAIGVFGSQRDAQLHANGLMSCFENFFQQESISAIKRAANPKSQSALFE